LSFTHDKNYRGAMKVWEEALYLHASSYGTKKCLMAHEFNFQITQYEIHF